MLLNRVKDVLQSKNLNINYLSAHFGINLVSLGEIMSSTYLDEFNVAELSYLASCLDVPVGSLFYDVKYKMFVTKYTTDILSVADTKAAMQEKLHDYIMSNLSILYDYTKNGHLQGLNEKIEIYEYVDGVRGKRIFAKTIDWCIEYMGNVFNILNIKNKKVIITHLKDKYSTEQLHLINRYLTTYVQEGLHNRYDVSKFINDKYYLADFFDYLENYSDYCHNRYRGTLLY